MLFVNNSCSKCFYDYKKKKKKISQKLKLKKKFKKEIKTIFLRLCISTKRLQNNPISSIRQPN